MYDDNKTRSSLVFAIYPNAIGFGYVYMENARKLISYGSVRINPISNYRLLKRITQEIEYLKPSIVVLQDPNAKSSRTGQRVRSLLYKIVQFARNKNLKYTQISRDQIRDVFQEFKAKTKYEICQVLLKEFGELEKKLPKKRKLWTSEDRNMAIFDALSLAISYYFCME
jgi:hypothetical protein